MKKVYSIMVLLAGLLGFSACEDDRDSNPTMQEPTTFVLNKPAYAAAPYDLEKSKSIELTCSQPDYGFTAATVYTVQVSLVNDFGTQGVFETLSTTYTTAKMNVDASEIAVAATGLADEDEANFPIQTKIYLRLKAALPNGMGEIYSNSIELSDVRLHFALPPVKLPKVMNMIGSFCDWNWNNAFPMVITSNGNFWRVIYFNAGDELKFNVEKSWDGGEFGSSADLQDPAGAGLSDNGGNIKIANAGWYLVVVRPSLEGRNIKYVVEFNAPNIYLFGKGFGDVWGPAENNLFSVPATADGSFVSPALTSDVTAAQDGIRVCVIVESAGDWWRSEFMVFDGKIKYRADGGDQDRVAGKAGQRVYLNFTAGTGELK